MEVAIEVLAKEEKRLSGQQQLRQGLIVLASKSCNEYTLWPG